MADTLAPKFRKRLPQSLTNHNLSHCRITYLKTKIDNNFLILQLPKQGDEQVKKFVKDVCPTAEIKTFFLFADKEDKPKS